MHNILSQDINDYLRSARNTMSRNKVIMENFSYITLMQLFLLAAPLLTYPYLTRVLGMELYGLVITANVLAGYATILVRFGFDAISARHVSLNRKDREKLSEIMSSIISIRFLLWIMSFLFYLVVVILVPLYRSHFLLFLYSFGLTLNTLLFPRFFFQGIEKMKYITIVNVLIQLVFVVLTFFVIKSQEDYLYVPLLHTAGYFLGGIASFYIIYGRYRLKFGIPDHKISSFYFKDALPIFSTDAICTIKDRLNYILLGFCVGLENVVIYDVGSKIMGICLEPTYIINTVIFPKMARDSNDMQFKKVAIIMIVVLLAMVFLANFFLHPIVLFLVGREIDLLPVRLYTLAPLLVGFSGFINQQLIIGRGYNRFVLYSIIVTTIAYLIMLGFFFFVGHLNTVTVFVGLTVLSYFVELIYRLGVANSIIKKRI